MIESSNARSSLCGLREWLFSHELLCVRVQSNLGHEQYIELTSDELRVEITLDRGEWSIGLGLLGMDHTYHPDEWEAWFDHVPLPWHLSDLDHQVAFIRNRWLAAAALARSDVPAAESELEAIGLDWVESRFGWRPSG